MLVDYEKAFIELKARLLSKNSCGQRDLLSLLIQLEVTCRVPEGEENFDPTPRPQYARCRVTPRGGSSWLI